MESNPTQKANRRVTTTHTIPDRKVVKTIGLVTGEAILGANIFKDIFAGIRDIGGGRSGAYERELVQAKEIALEEMEAEAERIGGNAME